MVVFKFDQRLIMRRNTFFLDEDSDRDYDTGRDDCFSNSAVYNYHRSQYKYKIELLEHRLK